MAPSALRFDQNDGTERGKAESPKGWGTEPDGGYHLGVPLSHPFIGDEPKPPNSM